MSAALRFVPGGLQVEREARQADARVLEARARVVVLAREEGRLFAALGVPPSPTYMADLCAMPTDARRAWCAGYAEGSPDVGQES